MHKEAQEEFSVRIKLAVIGLANHISVSEACRELNVPRSSFYRWKKKFDMEGRSGLYRKKPIPYYQPTRTPAEVVEKILEIRKEYQLGSLRIKYYLDRYHGIKISESTVSRMLKAHGVNCLPKSAPRRALHTKRYAKKVPEHQVQIDGKFSKLIGAEGRPVRRFQYTSIDDATRIRALQIYVKHNQDCAIKFIYYVIDRFPFHFSMIRTDRGHEFQARFHFHF